jgi:hypothetical protein
MGDANNVRRKNSGGAKVQKLPSVAKMVRAVKVKRY